jgi:poly(A) polymerase
MRAGHKPFRLLEHPRFRAAYDFLMLRCESGELDMEVGQWWKIFQHADTATREAMLLKETAPKLRKRNRRRKSAGTTDHKKAASPI